MLALFALGSPAMEGNTIKQVYQLTPAAKVLEVLAVREINKIEENCLSSDGDFEYHERIFPDTSSEGWLREAKELATLYHAISQNKSIPNKALFEAGAAYLSYITDNYEQARTYLKNVGQLNPSGSVKDQAMLTSLLITINQMPVIDSTAEAALLPAIRWLKNKADTEKQPEDNAYFYYDPNSQWHEFYRNLLGSILAPRYHQQKNIAKEALCIGNAEEIMKGQYQAEDFVRNKMQTKDIIQLYNLQGAATKTAWDRHLVDHFPMPKDAVSNVMAVSYTRDYDFKTALQWLNKIKNPEELKLKLNPFADLTFDNQDSTFAFDKGKFDKITFLKKMSALLEKEKQKKITSGELYQLALGFYNMTYYGRAWKLVKYDRSGSDGYSIPKDALPFEREYYGCFTAEKYFRRAMNASTNPEQKANYLFMMARCSQKQVQQPAFDFNGDYEKAERLYTIQFKNNKYFPELISRYRNTGFYKKAFADCSYLRDFVHKR